MHRKVDNKSYAIVDEWCAGFMQGIGLSYELSYIDKEIKLLLSPISIFGTEDGWEHLDQLSEQEMIDK